MMIRLTRFNVYLLLTLAAAALCGCKTDESRRKDTFSTLKIQVEVNPEETKNSEVAAIGRHHPVLINVDPVPLLTQVHVKSAKVVDTPGGFALTVEFGRKGVWLLEQFSVSNRGKRFGIFSKFVEPPGHILNAGRWLAAPRINQRIHDGVLTFTPDATREEAEEIARGLTNMGKKLGNDSEWQ